MRSTLEIRLACISAVLVRRCNDALLTARDHETPEAAGMLNSTAEYIERHVKNCEGDRPEWNVMAVSLRALASQIECRHIARQKNSGVSEQHARFAVLAQEVREKIANFDNVRSRGQLLSALGDPPGALNTTEFINCLLRLPLPTTYRAKAEDYLRRRPREKSEPIEKGPSVIKVIGSLDGVPLVAPSLVKQSTTYTLTFRISGERWPKKAQKLVLDFLTTCPSTLFSMSDFHLDRPASLGAYEGELSGEIIFYASQSMLAEPLTFELRCAFMDSQSKALTVGAIGYTRMQFRVDDPEDARLQSGHKHMDLHIANLLRELIQKSPGAKSELAELIPVLEALASVVGCYAQEGEYKGVSHVAESDFHRAIRKDLRIRLGNELQDHPNQAGGITDLRYKGVVMELKVEDKVSDREEIAKKYCAQLTQYEGTEARQVGVVLVLDLTPKLLPPGDIRNDIILYDVPTHGGVGDQKRFPSKAFLFVINGNTINPSAYSK